ncbi:hypothetical protein [Mycobacterium intracellulare]|uniref:Uncharacterized protein n=1 Tax=Mycobacterium intracellulare TaxID=1767 RepID=A0A7R7MXM8_MYCIT|nr:hypothetical protein [Mycobacterium intracellulare]BCP00703.1 hypothetical protein MINTM018_34720 [Mycobacterium intracellulare]
MTDQNLIDNTRSRCLCEIGCAYIAATAVDIDGCEHLVLARRDSLGDPTVRYDADCSDIDHEQTGPLPLEYVRRLTISRRRQRIEGTDQ